MQSKNSCFFSSTLATLKYLMDSKEAGFHELNVSLDRTAFIWTMWHPQSHHPSESEAWCMRTKALGLHGASNIVGQSLVLETAVWWRALHKVHPKRGVGEWATCNSHNAHLCEKKQEKQKDPLKTTGEETPTYPEDGSLETVCADLWTVDNAGRAGGAETVSRSGKGMEQSLWGRDDSQAVSPGQKLRAAAGNEMLFHRQGVHGAEQGRRIFLSLPPVPQETSY